MKLHNSLFGYSSTQILFVRRAELSSNKTSFSVKEGY
jgi:hypothetical protein